MNKNSSRVEGGQLSLFRDIGVVRYIERAKNIHGAPGFLDV